MESSRPLRRTSLNGDGAVTAPAPRAAHRGWSRHGHCDARRSPGMESPLPPCSASLGRKPSTYPRSPFTSPIQELNHSAQACFSNVKDQKRDDEEEHMKEVILEADQDRDDTFWRQISWEKYPWEK